MGLTTDRNSPCLHEMREDGQQKCYLVLSEEERARGFVRPIRTRYRHITCRVTTTMALPIAETYSRDPGFYNATYCCGCGFHYPLVNDEGIRQFAWIGADGKPDGSFVGE